MTLLRSLGCLSCLVLCPALALAGCGGSTAPGDASAVPTAAPPTPGSASAPPPASATAGPVAKPADQAEGDGDEPFGFRGDDEGARGPRWRSFPGPVVHRTLDGARIWAAVPLGDEWDVLALFVMDRVRSEGDEQVIRLGDGEMWVPNALVAPVVPGTYRPGDPVLVQLYDSLCAQYGRVVKADRNEITVRSRVIEDVEERALEPEYVVPLRDRQEFGASVAYEPLEEHWTTGILIYPGPGTAWVLPSTGVASAVDAGKLKVMAVTRRYSVGAKVLAEKAAAGGWLRPGVVRAVLDGGLGYRVEFDEGGTEERGFERVTAPW